MRAVLDDFRDIGYNVINKGMKIDRMRIVCGSTPSDIELLTDLKVWVVLLRSIFLVGTIGE